MYITYKSNFNKTWNGVKWTSLYDMIKQTIITPVQKCCGFLQSYVQTRTGSSLLPLFSTGLICRTKSKLKKVLLKNKHKRNLLWSQQNGTESSETNTKTCRYVLEIINNCEITQNWDQEHIAASRVCFRKSCVPVFCSWKSKLSLEKVTSSIVRAHDSQLWPFLYIFALRDFEDKNFGSGSVPFVPHPSASASVTAEIRCPRVRSPLPV